MPLVFGKSLYLHTLFFTVISLKTYRIDMSKILIIDDEVQIRTLLTRMMELEGYDVCQAGDCRAALKQLELQNPDVVLCDVFKVLKDAVSLAQKVSGTDVPVLLTGETGTGKEVFAQAIHYSSKRARQNFVAVNCSSFSKELLESEMFGHKAGSFTGALKDKKGLFEEANNGTIFLDEIGEMAFELQAKLLRILETGEYIKIGDTKPTRVNVRIIAATNRNLSQEIVAGRFREDLFYRLSVFQIHLPPLRERAGDIRLLAKAFIKSFAEQLARPVVEIAPAFLEALDSQPWKGNIRELRNVIERSMIVCESGYLDIADLPFDIQNAHYEHSNDSSPGSFELSAMERRHIARVLEYTKGNKTEAARLYIFGTFLADKNM